MSVVEFDRADDESPFLQFVRNEFYQRGTERRKVLSDKQVAGEEVQRLGLRVPKRFRVLWNIEDLKPWHIKRRAVLKYGRGWSARGVMLLERRGINQFFDHLSMQMFSLADIKTRQERVAESFASKDPNWILEELLEPTQSFGAIPYDYKFYVFGGQIGLIIQVDRNTSPPKLALFDGGFRPLRLGRDYLLTGKNCQPGVPLIPLHAVQLIVWAVKLASVTDAPFVSIDLYDTPSGPVFGEFTFSPGGTHKRMFTFSRPQLDYFDELFRSADSQAENNRERVTGQFSNKAARFVELVTGTDEKILAKTTELPLALYKTWSGAAYNHGHVGALRLSEYFGARAGKSGNITEAAIYKHLSSAWGLIKEEVKVLTEKHKAMALSRELEI